MNMMLVLQNEGVSLLWSVKHIFVFKELKIVSLVGRLCSESEVLYIEWDQTQQQQKRLVSETSCTRCRQRNALTHIKHHPLCSYRSSFIFRLVRCNKNAFSSHFCRRRSISNIFPSQIRTCFQTYKSWVQYLHRTRVWRKQISPVSM